MYLEDWCINIILRDYESDGLTFDLKINIVHCDLYFLVQWVCLISWRLFDTWTSYFRIMSQYDPTFDLKCRSLWPIFHGSVTLPYILKTIWTSNFGIMSQYDTTFDIKLKVGHCDIYFMVQWFCLISWKLFSGWTSYFGMMSQYDPTSDHKIFVGHCDLYFMVHWICHMSWRLFDVWTLYFLLMSQCNAAFALKQCRSQ